MTPQALVPSILLHVLHVLRLHIGIGKLPPYYDISLRNFRLARYTIYADRDTIPNGIALALMPGFFLLSRALDQLV
jgi:hypothetical protein